MYLLLAAIVLLLLFVASFSGHRTWVALGSTPLSVLLVAGAVFIATAHGAGPYLNKLAAEMPPLTSQTVRDLAMAAESTSASLAKVYVQASEPGPAPAVVAAAPESVPNVADSGGASADWISLDWPDISWFGTRWINPATWFGTTEPEAPEIDLVVAPNAAPQVADVPSAPEAPASLPTVRSQMTSDATTARADAAPSYKIPTPPDPEPKQEAGPLPEAMGSPVKWLPNAPAPAGQQAILLTGANVSNTPLENIQATLKPDSQDTALGAKGLALSLYVEGQDPTPGPDGTVKIVVPPGARFHLRAADISDGDAKEIGGAIVSFAYSQAGRRRTSIMYLKQAALSGAAGTH